MKELKSESSHGSYSLAGVWKADRRYIRKTIKGEQSLETRYCFHIGQAILLELTSLEAVSRSLFSIFIPGSMDYYFLHRLLVTH